MTGCRLYLQSPMLLHVCCMTAATAAPLPLRGDGQKTTDLVV